MLWKDGGRVERQLTRLLNDNEEVGKKPDHGGDEAYVLSCNLKTAGNWKV
jgi:hypothetical protein